MKIPLLEKPSVDLAEIHEYTKDLERITLLRDKCTDPEERVRYDTAIMGMQKVLIFLTRIRDNQKK